jgi:hypothetical protein
VGPITDTEFSTRCCGIGNARHVKSDIITAPLVRRILALRSKLLGTATVSIGRTEIKVGRFLLIPVGRRVEMFRLVDGTRRPIRAEELPGLEGRFRRALHHELRGYLGAPPKAEARLDVDRRALLELVDQAVPPATRARSRRRLALLADDPGAYRRRYLKPGEELEIGRAVVDTLVAAGVAAELDWRSEPEELRDALTGLARRAGFDRRIASLERNAEVRRALAEVKRALAAAGWTLIQLDLRTDSYPFLIIVAKAASRVRASLRALRIPAVGR